MDDKLSEEDVKRQYITPAIEAKWGKSTQNIRMEVKITKPRRKAPSFSYGDVRRRSSLAVSNKFSTKTK